MSADDLAGDAEELATALVDGQGSQALEVIFGGMYTDGPALALLLRATADVLRPVPPVVDGYATTDGLLMVWCEHEQRWHTHGRCSISTSTFCPHAHSPRAGVKCTCPVGNGDGHRWAHCSCPRSPYEVAGYTIREVGPFTAQVKRSHREARAGADCPGPECIAARAEAAERRWRFAFGLDVLEATCPKCGAGAGVGCVISRGHVHSARHDARMRMGRGTIGES